jgi:hypothetical protein
MTEHPKDVSRDTLEWLLARAHELDTESNRLSLTEAREIARGRGVSEPAWNAAVAERYPDTATEVDRPESRFALLRTTLTAGFGFAAGAGAKWLNTTYSGDLDVVYGGLLVAIALVLAARERRESPEAAESVLDAWWVAVPAGMLVSFGGLRTDPILFAALARWGTGWLSTHLPRLARFFRESDASTSTA